MDFQPSAGKHAHRPCSWSPGLLQVLIIFASLASLSVSEFTSADGFEGRSSRFVDVHEQSRHPPASHRLEIGKSAMNIPLEEQPVANVDERDVHTANPSNHQQSPDTTGWSLSRKVLGSLHYNARKLSNPGSNPGPNPGPGTP